MPRARRSTQQSQGVGNNEEIPLLTRNANHTSARAYDDPDFRYRVRNRRMTITYDEQIEPILERFGLKHVAKLGEMKVDVALMTALVERWRRETHTFHLPTGEITPTLEDVCCLLGLPVNGDPIVGESDENWADDVEEVFGWFDWETFAKPPGTFHARVEWLRRPYVPHDQEEILHVPTVLPPDSPPEVVRLYAIAYMLDLFGSVMFPDHSGYLYTMFLQFIHNVDNPPQISWGSGLLAYLYRGLCKACDGKKKELTVPCVFLQIWTWTRFPIGRPRAQYFEDGLEGRPLGARWVGEHNYEDVPHGSVIVYRRQFEELRQEEVNWTPYEGIMDELPELCLHPQHTALYFYEGPLIWFWIVEGYTPRRVMRQFKKRQMIPPPLLPCPDEMHNIRHKGLEHRDWAQVHAESVAIWGARTQQIVPHEEPFDNATWRQYMAWFNRAGMRSVFWRASTALNINDPQPLTHVDNEINRRYNPQGQRVQQTVRLQLFHSTV